MKCTITIIFHGACDEVILNSTAIRRNAHASLINLSPGREKLCRRATHTDNTETTQAHSSPATPKPHFNLSERNKRFALSARWRDAHHHRLRFRYSLTISGFSFMLLLRAGHASGRVRPIINHPGGHGRWPAGQHTPARVENGWGRGCPRGTLSSVW